MRKRGPVQGTIPVIVGNASGESAEGFEIGPGSSGKGVKTGAAHRIWGQGRTWSSKTGVRGSLSSYRLESGL